MPADPLLKMMAVGYLLTVSMEIPVLLAGFWLTACTYPIVWLVLPPLFESRMWYLIVAETFAPLGECLLFLFTLGRTNPASRRDTLQDMMTITVANLISFGLGELFNRNVGWDWL